MMSINSFVNKVLVLCLILLSGSVLHVGFFTITYTFCIILVSLALVCQRKVNKNKLYLFIISSCIFTFIFNFNFIFSISNQFKEYFILCMRMYLSLGAILVLINKNVDYKLYLYQILRVLISLSLIGFFLSSFNIGKQIKLGEGYIVYTIFYLFYYFSKITIGSFVFYRNQGVFWEPGILAIYSNIFLFLSLFVYRNMKNVFLSIVCVLTTASTTGFFVLFLQLVFYMRRFNFIKQIKLYLFVIAPILILSIVSFLDKKSEADDFVISSFGLRMIDLYSGFMIALENPVVGIGLDKEAYFSERDKVSFDIKKEVFDLIYCRGNSNALLTLFYTMGLPIAFLILYSFYKQNIFIEQKNLFFVIMLISFCSEPLLFTPFFMFFIFTGFQNILTAKLL